MKKKKILLLIRLVVSTGLITYFIYTLSQKHGGISEGFQQFIKAFSDAPVQWLIPAGLLHIVGFSLMSIRWKILLRGQDVHTSFGQLFIYYFIAAFFNLIFPSTIGGDTVRVIESKKLTGCTSTSMMVVIIERLTGMMALVLIAATGLIITFFRNAEHAPQAWLLLGLALACFLTIFLLAHPKVAPGILKKTEKIFPLKIHSFLKKAYSAVEIYYKRPGTLLLAQAVSIIFQLNIVVYFFLIARALHQNPDPIEFMMKIPVVIFLLMTVPAINGLGVRTASFKGLMGYADVYALAVESIDLGFRISYGLLGGLVFLFYSRPHKRNEQK